jgi:hypothetical protein
MNHLHRKCQSSLWNGAEGFAARAVTVIAFSSLILPPAAGRAQGAATTRPPTTAELNFFEKNIRPVLVNKCYECHSLEAKKLKGGLLVDSRDGLRKGGDSGPAIVPGKPAESLLIQAIRHQDADLAMPPKEKLPDSVVADFERWIAMGAPDPRAGAVKIAGYKVDPNSGRNHWSFQPPRKSGPPAVKNPAWPRSDIDRFILAGLEAKGLKPVADADRATLIRRVYFDLTGLPPAPEAVEAFVKDSDPKAFEKIVDQLLASPQFGERWGRHWLDVARYAESTGKERNLLYSEAWRYRDYVIASFNANKPYDRFVREQIAGDLLLAANDQQRLEHAVATGFLAIGTKSLNERNRLQFKLDVIDEQIDVLSQAILGVTIACARCHDHKFDPIPTRDYYALAGIFNSTETRFGVAAERGVRQASGLLEVPLTAAPKPPTAQANTAETARLQGELQKAKAERAAFMTSVQQAKKGNQAKLAELRKKGRPYLDQLNSKIENLETRLRKNGGEPAGPTVQVMGVKESAGPADLPIYLRGDIDKPGERVPRGLVPALGPTRLPAIKPQSSGRLELAASLTSPENPLTARVMVNRMWHHLFGRGIVPTVDNFGATGERPTHPELLDHLALRFVEQGWSVKKMIREIVLSRAYQLSAAHDTKNYAADPDNTLVWRMSKRRLDAEALRDAMLAVSGQIDLTPPQGSTLPQGRNNYVGRGLSASAFAFNSPKRSVYLPVVRDLVPDSLELFDFAEPSLVVGNRDTTTVPSQALYLMNNPFVLRQAEAAAARVLGAKAATDAGRINLAYRLAFARPPSAGEWKDAEAFLKEFTTALGAGKTDPQAAWTAFCQALFAAAEFRYLN